MRSCRTFRILLTAAAMLCATGVAAAARKSASAATQSGSGVSENEPLGEYVGQYRGTADAGQLNSVYLEGGVLYEESEHRERQRLTADAGEAEAADRFRLEVTPAHVVFLRDAAGQVSGLRFVLDRDGRTLREERRVSTVGARLNLQRQYTRQEAMLPMRDGVRLHAVILRPAHAGASETLPFLMDRTPYGVDGMDSEAINRDKPELAASGYIFVFEDIRGRYGSEGRFVMNRPVVPQLAKNDVDETTDTHDTIDWLLKNVPGNNGRVGVYGVSYDGFLAMMAGIDAHPAVQAISPQAPMTDVWMGDDFFHNGAFRESYGFDYVQEMEAQRTDVPVDMKGDTFDFFLRNVNFAGAAKDAGMSKLPTAVAFLTQPAYTKFWQAMAVEDHLTQVEVPTLEVGGYWDQEDLWGTQAEYAALKQHDTKHEVFLVLGPWNHDGWERAARQLSTAYGTVELGEATGTEFRRTFEAPFFERYLKDRAGFDLADAASFRTGVNAWRRYDVWPPKEGFAAARLYLEPGKRLSFVAPQENAGGAASGSSGASSEVAASYVSNPADPVPYRHRPIQSTYGKGSGWYTWLAEDQSFVAGRKDVATFAMPALDHDVTVTGEVTADLFAATTGSDADWVVKLIDEYPSDAAAPDAGYQLMVAEEIFRGRYRKSFEQPEALTPNTINEFRWSLHGVDHTFLKGHRILVEVQSSWFPLYDRNPQTFVPNIMTAPKGAYKAETMTIYGSARYPSRLELPVASSVAK
jgi:putative CocE/NonD family hydrolase